MVAPAAIETVAGAIATVEGSLLLKVTVTPPAGAGLVKVTGKEAVWFGTSATPAGKLIPPAETTVTLAVPAETFGAAAALAEMDACPEATPVTGTLTLMEPGAKVTPPGTVAAAGLLELKVTARPAAGAGADKFKVTD